MANPGKVYLESGFWPSCRCSCVGWWPAAVERARCRRHGKQWDNGISHAWFGAEHQDEEKAWCHEHHEHQDVVFLKQVCSQSNELHANQPSCIIWSSIVYTLTVNQPNSHSIAWNEAQPILDTVGLALQFGSQPILDQIFERAKISPFKPMSLVCTTRLCRPLHQLTSPGQRHQFTIYLSIAIGKRTAETMFFCGGEAGTLISMNAGQVIH